MHGGAPAQRWWRGSRNLDFTVARKQANSRSTTKCAGPTRYFSMPPLLSHSLFLFPPSLTSPMRAVSGLWISPGERRRGPAGWWRSGRLATGTSIHLSLPLSPAMEALTGAPPPRLVLAVVFSGDGGLPGLPGPLTFPERRPLISAAAERPTPRRIPQRRRGRRGGAPQEGEEMTDEIDREQRSMGMQRSPIRLCCFAANQATTPPPDGSWIPYFPPSRLQIRAGCLLITRATSHHIIAHIR